MELNLKSQPSSSDNNIQSQKFFLLAKTLGVAQSEKAQKVLIKSTQLLFKMIFSNEVFLRLLEQVILHQNGEEFLEEFSAFYQQVLKFEVKLKNILTLFVVEKSKNI